jgi:prepilin-type N-terminal cleavage/methylation domain-containing protein
MRWRRPLGFTLIELMIAVAIVAVLAALALTSFRRFQLRSKASEARLDLASIVTAELAYFGEFSTYIAAGATPAGAEGPDRRPWAGGGSAAFASLGFIPIGDVLFTYAVDTDLTGTAFTAGARGDLDGNTTPSEFGYVLPLPGATAGVPSTLAPSCSPNGVFSPTGPQLATVGPCTNVDGTSRF